MALDAGSRLGSYEVLTLIGRGGIGEVYRARDVKLNRDIALKVLPDDFARDSARLARLHREVQLLAALGFAARCAAVPRDVRLRAPFWVRGFDHVLGASTRLDNSLTEG